MINLDGAIGENKKEHNPNWSQIYKNPFRILIIRGSVSGRTNALLNLISHQPDINKIYLYSKDPYKQKYQLLIKKCESVGPKHSNDPKAFIKYSNVMKDIYENNDE